MSIREQIARYAYWHFSGDETYTVDMPIPLFPIEQSNRAYALADQIIAIEGLEQRAENQELPENPFSVRSFDSMRAWEKGLSDMLKGDSSGYWVKVKRL